MAFHYRLSHGMSFERDCESALGECQLKTSTDRNRSLQRFSNEEREEQGHPSPGFAFSRTNSVKDPTEEEIREGVGIRLHSLGKEICAAICKQEVQERS